MWLASIERSFWGLSIVFKTVKNIKELMEIWPNEVCDSFLLWTSSLYMSLYSLSWLVPVCKMFYECLLSSVWLGYLAAYLSSSWVSMVSLVLLRLVRLHCLSFCLTLLFFLLYILPLLNCGPIPLVYQLLPFCYSIRFSLLSILLSILYLSCIFLHQNPKSLSLLHLVIKLLNLWRQVSWCLLPA